MGHYVDLASDAISEAKKRLEKRRISRDSAHYIEKSIFVMSVEVPPELLDKSGPRAPYEQAALVRMIKDGIRPRFSQFKPW
jgi:hypothetical protein